MAEDAERMSRGSIPRFTRHNPSSVLTFMAVDFPKDHFKGVSNDNTQEVASISAEKKGSPLQWAA